MDNKQAKEIVITSATYGGHEIHLTNRYRFIVLVHGVPYPVKSLEAAKQMIDDLKKTQRN